MGYVGIFCFKTNNSLSVLSAIKELGEEVKFITSSEDIAKADRLIIPGVGHIDSVVQEMDELNFRDDIKKFASQGKFVLGICLGQHLLGLQSEESATAETLGILDFNVSKLPNGRSSRFRVPHVGWNSVEHDGAHPLFLNISPGNDFYFSHSFAITTKNSITLATTEHSAVFASAAGKDNVLSVQFHPEKSQRAGLQLLKNFCEL